MMILLLLLVLLFLLLFVSMLLLLLLLVFVAVVVVVVVVGGGGGGGAIADWTRHKKDYDYKDVNTFAMTRQSTTSTFLFTVAITKLNSLLPAS